jgi:2-polyprenyl-6-methoxyphenol hydroxylase-like FAD-dependent oxidoreductase
MAYDVIVVGARCAGAATALLLARKGYRTPLLDRATFPSDGPNGNCIIYPGVRQLERWGLLERVLDTGCPPIDHWMSDLGDGPVAGRVYAPDGLPAAVCPRRMTLDALLLEAAIEAGAEARTGFHVTDLLREDEWVFGVKGTFRGRMAFLRAYTRVVVGADGRHSLVARLVGAAAYAVRPPLTCWYSTFWNDVPVARLE